MKLTESGNLLWAKALGDSYSNDIATCIRLDNTSNCYITGYFGGTVDFDPNAGIANLTSQGEFDFFILKLDALGNYSWAKRVGGTLSDFGQSLAINSFATNLYISGGFNQTVDFDPGTSTYNLTAVNGVNAFVLKLTQQ